MILPNFVASEARLLRPARHVGSVDEYHRKAMLPPGAGLDCTIRYRSLPSRHRAGGGRSLIGGADGGRGASARADRLPRRRTAPLAMARRSRGPVGSGGGLLGSRPGSRPRAVHRVLRFPHENYGLTAKPGVFLHNAANGDLSDEVVPWAQAAWTQVHQGHLPLWIRDEALGMPLAFNFGSAAFSLPALVSYLTPLGAVLWVQILVSLVVGGTGAYFFGRVLGLHPVACAFAGTTWVLSGPFFGYLGLPDTSVMSWAGWQFAAVVLIVRGTHRIWSVALLAVTFALLDLRR